MKVVRTKKCQNTTKFILLGHKESFHYKNLYFLEKYYILADFGRKFIKDLFSQKETKDHLNEPDI